MKNIIPIILMYITAFVTIYFLVKKSNKNYNEQKARTVLTISKKDTLKVPKPSPRGYKDEIIADKHPFKVHVLTIDSIEYIYINSSLGTELIRHQNLK